jgi:hypothetical protein
MSDLADTGAFSLGIANNISQNFGPTATANQANTNANTALTQQQAQAAAIQNANARLQYQLFARGVQRVTDFSGQDGPNLGAGVDDSSGVTADYASPASAPPAGTPNVPPTPEDDIGQSASKQALIESWLEREYNVNPTGTNAEQGAILQAQAAAVQAKLSGNSGLAAAAEQRIQMLVTRRDQNVKDRQNAAQLDASQHYDKLSAVESAPDGQAFDTLTAIAPNSATLIQKQNPDATPEELDEIARDTTAHVAAFVHRFTNRETTVGEDGATYDKQSGLRVDVPIRGVSPDRQAALLDQANKIVTTENSDGSKTTEPQFRKDGYNSASTWVTDAVAQIRARNGANTNVEAAGNHAIQFGHLTPGAPPVPGGTLYRPPQQSGPQQQPGQPQQPGAAPQPGQQPQRPDNGLLPGVNPDALPKIQMPTVRLGTSQTPADLKTSEGVATARLEQMKASNDAYTQDQKEGALLKAAQREAAALAANPRMAGPGSEVAQWIAKARTAVTGQATDSLVDLGGLDKILLQLGAQNVRQALSGQKITQAEFLMMLGKGNPNTEQPLATINKLLGYLGAQNDYDQRFNRTKMMALNRGANPLTVDSDIGAQADRGDYVESRVGVRPPIAGGQQTSGPSSGGGTGAPETRTYQGKTYVLTPGAPRNNPNSWKAQ